MRKILAIGFVLIGSWILGAEDMPKLCWMDDEKARRAVTNVVMKVLREDKSLSYAGGTRSAFGCVGLAASARVASVSGGTRSVASAAPMQFDVSGTGTGMRPTTF